MTSSQKVKISITLSDDLLTRIDAAAAKDSNRSAVIENWLRAAERKIHARAIDDEVAAYYDNLTRDEVVEEEALARASSQAARRLVFDDVPRSTKR